jgi:hypothetical protein
MGENVQLSLDQVAITDLRNFLGRCLVQGLRRSEHATQCGVDHDNSTDLRIRFV